MISTSITVKPDPLTFGCICEGFVYKLKVYLYNHGTVMDRFRIELSSDNDADPNTIISDYRISNVAPGMGTSFHMELRAIAVFQTSYSLVIRAGSTKQSDTINITAVILPRDVFRKVAKSVILRDKGIYAPGVKCLGLLAGDPGGGEDLLLLVAPQRSTQRH